MPRGGMSRGVPDLPGVWRFGDFKGSVPCGGEGVLIWE